MALVKRIILILTLSVFALSVLAGCGGGDLSPGGSPASVTPSTANVGLRVDFNSLNNRDLLPQTLGNNVNVVVVDVLSTDERAIALIPQERVVRPAADQPQIVDIVLQNVPIGVVQVLVRGLDTSDQVVGSYQETVEVRSGSVTSVEATLFADPMLNLPPLAAGQLRFVLTWNAEPRDLDSHLWLPPTTPFHLFFSRRGDLNACPFANLDIDETNGFGPEVVTISNFQPGQYEYVVEYFSGSGTLATSGAQVQVLNSAGVVATFNVPTSGVGNAWHVVSVDGTTQALTPVNTVFPSFQPYPDTASGCM